MTQQGSLFRAGPTHTKGEREEMDRYYTPDPLARALVGLLPINAAEVCLEPHVGGGAFARALDTAKATVLVNDADPNAAGLQGRPRATVGSFLTWKPGRSDLTPLWVVGNPPYRDALDHIRHGVEVSTQHVAFLLRLAILESAERAAFWSAHPCRAVWPLAQRPSFTGQGTDSCAYGWFWWDWSHEGPTRLMPPVVWR